MGVDLAVDGGQSQMRVARVHRVGGIPRPDTPLETTGFSWTAGVDPVATHIEVITDAWRRLGSPSPVGTLACGLSGIPSAPEGRTRLAAKLSGELSAARVVIAGDDVITHAGALAGEPGVVLAAGTGVVATALDAAGGWATVDAWGYLFGDAGGGSWLGQRGLRVAMAASEGRRPPTRLTDRAVERFGELRGFVHRVLASPTMVSEVASFARDVLVLANAGDEAAATLCSRAASELATTAAATVRRGFPDAAPGRVPFTWTGSILVEWDIVRTPMLADLVRECPQVSMRPPLGSALDGAARLAATSGTAHHALSTQFPTTAP